VPLYVVIVALSAACFGGDEAAWGEVVPVIGIGLLLFFCPPRTLPNRLVLIGLAGLICSGLFAFLPSRWFGEPEWHGALRQALPGLASTVSLQPWHSFQRFGVMLAVALFAVWVIQWRPRHRVHCVRLLTAGIALVAAVALAVWFYGIAAPGWHPPQGFGPFANRNQTGTLMALGAMLAFGLIAHAARKRQWMILFWVSAFAVCLAALLLSNSRAPLCLLAVGCLVWVFQRLKFSAKGFALSGGTLLLLAAAALVIGEQVARRFPDLLTNGAGFRAKIYHDTFRLIGATPLEGVGIGNFEAIFPLFRHLSLNTERVIHPESDWLWLISELGWLSVVGCAIGVVGVFRRPAHPGTKGEKEILLAGLIAMAAFLVNSLFDVPGHRLGTILPILVLCGICTHAKLAGEGWPVISWIGRLLGIGLVVFGFVLLKETRYWSRLELARYGRNPSEIETAASNCLRRTPLNWPLYVTRGYANIYQQKWLQAVADFRYALLLEPKLPVVPFNEGRVWVGVNRELAFAAWKECLRRSQDGERNEFYRLILGSSYGDSSLREAVLRLSDTDSQLAGTALRSGYADATTLEFLEEEKSTLGSEQIQALLRKEASEAAIGKEYEKAYQIARQGMKSIAFPVAQPLSEGHWRVALIRDPTDLVAAYNLCLTLRSQERWQEELEILEVQTRVRNCPDYLRLMKAEILASQNEWPEAWSSISGLMR
jgi:O-antigen ligase/tetratricopeptide (TPR) repeat protein